MKVYLATIRYANDIYHYAGGTKAELLAKLAEYVRSQAATEWPQGRKPNVDLSDDDLVFAFFNGNDNALLDEDSDVIGVPAPASVEFDDSFRPQGTAIESRAH